LIVTQLNWLELYISMTLRGCRMTIAH